MIGSVNLIQNKIYLNKQKSAVLSTYILNGEISYGIKRKRPAIIICPGGGYLTTATKEGEAVAVEFMAQGYHCFVLEYSTYFKNRMTNLAEVPPINSEAHYPRQVIELMESMHLIHENAEEWNIETDNVFVLGFSAGGHIAISLGNRWNDNKLMDQLPFIPQGDELKPKGVILGYPMLHGDIAEYIISKAAEGNLIKYQTKYIYDCLYGTDRPAQEQLDKVDMIFSINSDTPPVFIWTTSSDEIINSQSATQFVQRMQEKQIECEYHLFEEGKHGLSLATDLYTNSADGINVDVNVWVILAKNWLKRQCNKR